MPSSTSASTGVLADAAAGPAAALLSFDLCEVFEALVCVAHAAFLLVLLIIVLIAAAAATGRARS
jgi:hypothetical protein